jgi:hypothetical protein
MFNSCASLEDTSGFYLTLHELPKTPDLEMNIIPCVVRLCGNPAHGVLLSLLFIIVYLYAFLLLAKTLVKKLLLLLLLSSFLVTGFISSLVLILLSQW